MIPFQGSGSVAGAVLAARVSYALTAYVADVAVYPNMDAKSKDLVTRNAILQRSIIISAPGCCSLPRVGWLR